MKQNHPEISSSKVTTQNTKNSQTNNQSSISEIRMENNGGNEEIFENLENGNQNNTDIQNQNIVLNKYESINFEAIQCLEKNTKEDNKSDKSSDKSNDKNKTNKNKHHKN